MSSCPHCSATLRTVRPWNIPAAECPHCHGLWFDAGNAKTYARAADRRPFRVTPHEEEFVAEELGHELRCPTCGTLTLRPGFANSLCVYRCSSCLGVFIGAGELKALRPHVPASPEEAHEPSVVEIVDTSVNAARVAVDIVQMLLRIVR